MDMMPVEAHGTAAGGRSSPVPRNLQNNAEKVMLEQILMGAFIGAVFGLGIILFRLLFRRK